MKMNKKQLQVKVHDLETELLSLRNKADQSIKDVVTKPLSRWENFKASVKEWFASKTTWLGVIPVFFTGLLDTLGQIDLEPAVSYFVSNSKAVGAVMVALAAFFGVHRLISAMTRPKVDVVNVS
jgi:hypothetical protein